MEVQNMGYTHNEKVIVKKKEERKMIFYGESADI